VLAGRLLVALTVLRAVTGGVLPGAVDGVGRRGVPALDRELDADLGRPAGGGRVQEQRLLVEEAGDLPLDLLERAQRRASSGPRPLAVLELIDQLAGRIDCLVVEELVVDGDDRRVVAGGEALGVLQRDLAVLGCLVVRDAEVVGERGVLVQTLTRNSPVGFRLNIV
jgi:hypothetical protein